MPITRQAVLLGEAERDEEEEELRDDDVDLEDADGEPRLEGAETMANDEVSCPAICINFA